MKWLISLILSIALLSVAQLVNSRDADRSTPLHEAAQAFDVETVSLLLSKGAKPDALDDFGNTPLQSALQMYTFQPGLSNRLIPREDLISTVRALVLGGSNVNVREKDHGRTPIFGAVMSGVPEVVDILVAKGANMAARDLQGITPLLLADNLANDAMVEMLIEKGAPIQGIHEAVIANDAARVRLLVAVDPLLAKKRSGDGKTPLHRARSGAVAEALVAAGADADARDEDGRAPLHTARALEAKRALIASGADVNAEDKGGLSPLSCCLQSIESMKLLLDSGADPNGSKKGWSPLQSAAFVGARDAAELLVSRGASAKESSAPLHFAVEYAAEHAGDAGVVEVILRAGADVNARDEDGRTALLQVLSLFEAMKYAKTESEYSGGKISPRFCEVMFKDLKPAPVARLLIAHGADVNAASRKGQTPIAYAALSGDIELVGELLAKGADANVKDAYGTTPLELAISSGHKEIAAMLREHGAKE